MKIKKEREIRQSRDKRSSVMEEIFVSLRSNWLDKVNTPHMEYVIYSMFKLFFAILHVTHISKVQNHRVDKLMIEDADSICETNSFLVSLRVPSNGCNPVVTRNRRIGV